MDYRDNPEVISICIEDIPEFADYDESVAKMENDGLLLEERLKKWVEQIDC